MKFVIYSLQYFDIDKLVPNEEKKIKIEELFNILKEGNFYSILKRIFL